MPFADYQDFLEAETLESVAAFGDQEMILGEGEDAETANALSQRLRSSPSWGCALRWAGSSTRPRTSRRHRASWS